MLDKHFDAASVAIFRGDEVLLIKRATKPFAGYWSLPGGRREAGETAETCAKREVDEELSLTLSVKFVTRLGQDGRGMPFVLMVFAGRFDGGNVSASDEIADWRFVPPGELAALKTTPYLARVVAMASQVITTA